MKRNYPLLLVSQFLGAFGDNAILMVILGQLTIAQQAGRITQQQLSLANAIYTSLLFIPYLFCGPLAGFLSDRFAKTHWLLGGNSIKLVGTAVAMLQIWCGGWYEGVGYFLVGVGACVYSPAKYGILPEILPTERLVKANGTVEMLTLVAILVGNIVGAKMIDKLPVGACYAILLAIYGFALLMNLIMHKTPTHAEIRFRTNLGEFVSHFRTLVTHARWSRILCGTALFWVCGAFMKMNFQPWGLDVIGLTTNTEIALLGLWLSLGIMIGSVSAGHLHRISDLTGARRYGFILAVIIAGLSLVTVHGLVIATLIACGVAAGLFLIPLNAALQAETDATRLGKTIAVQNFIENGAMICGSLVIIVATKVGLGPQGRFLLLAALVAGVIAWLRIPSKEAH